MKKANVFSTCMAGAFLIFTLNISAQSQEATTVITNISGARDDNNGNDILPPPPPGLEISEFGIERINFYPNPCNDILFIQAGSSGPQTITIYNLVGTLVMEQKIDQGTKSLDLSNLRSGIYFINDGHKSYRLEKA